MYLLASLSSMTLRYKHPLLLTRSLCIALWEMWCLSPISVAKAGPWPSQMDEMGHREHPEGRAVSSCEDRSRRKFVLDSFTSSLWHET